MNQHPGLAISLAGFAHSRHSLRCAARPHPQEGAQTHLLRTLSESTNNAGDGCAECRTVAISFR